MNKILFALSGIMTLMSIFILFLTSIINLIIPKIGLLAFSIAQSGTLGESRYIIDFRMVNICAIILIVIGLGLCAYTYKKQKSE